MTADTSIRRSHLKPSVEEAVGPGSALGKNGTHVISPKISICEVAEEFFELVSTKKEENYYVVYVVRMMMAMVQ